MAEAPTVTIGGEVYSLPTVITLGPIEAFNPFLKQLRATIESADLIDLALIAVQIVSVVMQTKHPELTPEGIKERLVPAEFAGLRHAMWEVLVISGLYTRAEKKPGEAKPPETPAGKPSRKSTSAGSSPS